GQGRASRQAHLARESQWPRFGGGKEAAEKNLMMEISVVGDVMPSPERPMGPPFSMIAGSFRSLRLKDPRDHGSRGGGGWRGKSGTARSAHSQPAPPLLTGSSRPNRTKHTPKREQAMKSQHDHGSGAGGATASP